MASLEGAKYGLAYASGMAAITTVVNLLSSGDHIVSSVDLYGGTSIYLKQVADRLNIKTTFVADVTDPSNIEKAITDNTRVRPGFSLFYSTTQQLLSYIKLHILYRFASFSWYGWKLLLIPE